MQVGEAECQTDVLEELFKTCLRAIVIDKSGIRISCQNEKRLEVVGGWIACYRINSTHTYNLYVFSAVIAGWA
jgi:hypothetical protein